MSKKKETTRKPQKRKKPLIESPDTINSTELVWQEAGLQTPLGGLSLEGVGGALAILQEQLDAAKKSLGLPTVKSGEHGVLDALRQDLDEDEYILEYDVRLVSKKNDIIKLKGRSTVSNLYGTESIGAAPDRMQHTFYTSIVQPFNIKFQKSLAAQRDGGRQLSVDSAAGMHHDPDNEFNSPMRLPPVKGASGMGRG